mgnify:CR=1 FL=1
MLEAHTIWPVAAAAGQMLVLPVRAVQVEVVQEQLALVAGLVVRVRLIQEVEAEEEVTQTLVAQEVPVSLSSERQHSCGHVPLSARQRGRRLFLADPSQVRPDVLLHSYQHQHSLSAMI